MPRLSSWARPFSPPTWRRTEEDWYEPPSCKQTYSRRSATAKRALAAFREFHRLDRELHNLEAERRSRLTMARFEVENARRETQLAQSRVAQLEALDQDKRDFLASVSHELRTPLTAVMGFATELAESWDRFDDSEARNVIQLIARQSADISNIVDDLLTVTRLEAGTMSVHLQAIDVLDQAGALVETLARDGGRKIEWSGDTRVWADPTRLRQIVRNLVTNALRYGGDKVKVLVSSTDGVGQILVQDSGGPILPSRVPPCSTRSSIGTMEVARPTLSAWAWRSLEASRG